MPRWRPEASLGDSWASSSGPVQNPGSRAKTLVGLGRHSGEFAYPVFLSNPTAAYISCTFKRPVMFHKMNVKNGSKDLKKYPQISRRVRDTLARIYYNNSGSSKQQQQAAAASSSSKQQQQQQQQQAQQHQQWQAQQHQQWQAPAVPAPAATAAALASSSDSCRQLNHLQPCQRPGQTASRPSSLGEAVGEAQQNGYGTEAKGREKGVNGHE